MLYKWKSVLLYGKNYTDKSVLKELFFHIISRAGNWQGLVPRTVANVEALCIAVYLALEESHSSSSLF